MKHLLMSAVLLAATTLFLGGCFEPEPDHKAKAQQETSEKLWNIPPPDRSKDKGFTP